VIDQIILFIWILTNSKLYYVCVVFVCKHCLGLVIWLPSFASVGLVVGQEVDL